MRIEVDQVRDDELQRAVWVFQVWNGYCFVLREFSFQERATKRHKWRVTSRWDAFDERPYHSTLPRPVTIPTWVMAKAFEQIKPQFYVGWMKTEHIVKE